MQLKSSLGLGVIYAVIAAFLFATLGALIKVSTHSLEPPVVLFGRQLFSLATIMPYVGWWAYRNRPRALVTERFSAHLARAIVSLSAGYCVVFAIALIPLPDAITLSYSRPLFLPLVVWIWTGKRMELPVWLGLLLGFIGVALILKPGKMALEVGTFIGLGAGILGAVAILCIRRLTKVEPPPRILGYYFLLSTILTAIPVVFHWQHISGQEWGMLAAIGVIGAIYQFFLTLAYKAGRATIISAILYVAIIFTLLWSWILWREIPDWWSIGGIILICGGALTSLIFSHARAAPGEQPPTSTSERP